jgi:uncharacterized protein involved in outer membrane biogenesis
MTSAPSLPRHWRTTSIVAASLLAVVAIAIGACLVFVRTESFQQVVVRYAADRLSRQIEVGGTLNLNFLSSTPTLTATDVRLSNPEWMPKGVAAEIGHLKVVFDFPWPGRQKSILRLEMVSAQLHLVRDAEGRANWQWSAPGVPKKQRGLLIRSLSMPDARVVLDDARRHLQFEGIVTAGDVRGATAPAPLRIEGKGQLNGRAATFSIDGEPLATARHDRPYGFSFVERSGDSQLRGHGHLLQPFDPGMLDAEFAANGVSMNELYFLAGMHFPNSAPFTLTGKVERRGPQSKFSDLAAHFGRSDLRGTVAMRIVEGRARYDADLSSELLRLSDFGRHKADGSPVATPSPESLLLPDAKVPLNGLRNRDATIRYRANTVESRSLSVTRFSTEATIDRGVLIAKRVSGRLRESHVAGTVKIDVRGESPQTTLDLTMTDLPLAQFARKENKQPPFEGMLQVRMDISGRGNSVHELASTASGTLSLSLSHGAMRASMAEMTAATLRGLGLTLTKSDQETPVRCGVANFRAQDGVLNAERIVIDTDPVLIHGAGSVRLDTEALDFILRGDPKQARLFRLRKPVALAGSLKHPSVKMAASDTDKAPQERFACEPASLAARVPGDAPVKR